jgi:RNA polymerase sigma-70 factor (ECF subfamily)
MQDRAWLGRLVAGDETAFRALASHFDPRLGRLARAFTPMDAQVAEIVSETWNDALLGLRNYEARTPLRTWLFELLVRRARETVRTEPPAPWRTAGHPLADVDPEDEPEPGMDASGTWHEPPEDWTEVEAVSIALRRDTHALLERAIGFLPQPQRLVLLLRDLEGLTPAETCRVLGIDAGEEARRLRHARSWLRRTLADARYEASHGWPAPLSLPTRGRP